MEMRHRKLGELEVSELGLGCKGMSFAYTARRTTARRLQRSIGRSSSADVELTDDDRARIDHELPQAGR
jgi:hypothetical protein